MIIDETLLLTTSVLSTALKIRKNTLQLFMLMKAEWIWVGIFRIRNVLKIDEFD